MFFHFFLFSSLSHVFPSTVLTLTDSNFKSIVDERSNKSIIMVMFHGDRCPACQSSYPAFAEASRTAVGLVTFGHVDCSRNQDIPYRFHIKSIPAFYVFHPNGEAQYSAFFRSASGYVKAALSYVPDYLIEKATVNWVDDDTKAVVLLTNRWYRPPEFDALALNFSGLGIHFGFANDMKTRKEFNITATGFSGLDNVFFINKGKMRELGGNFSFRRVQREIYREFGIEAPKKRGIQERVTSKLDFIVMCKNKPRYCVIEPKIRAEQLSEKVKEVANKYKNGTFRFLVCGEKCPSNELKENEIYVFNTKRDEMIKAKDAEELASVLGKVLDGTAKWEPSVFGNRRKTSEL